MMTPIVQPLGLVDVDALLSLAKRAARRPWTRAQMQAELTRPQSQALGIRNGQSQELCGYIFFWVVAGEMEVVDLLVSTDFRRQGVAAVLLQEAIGNASIQGALRVFLEVRPSNVAARRLYENAGFVQVGIRPGYYLPEGEDALVLQLSLAESS